MKLKKLIVGLFGIWLFVSNLHAGTCDTTEAKKIVITLTDASVVKSGFGLAVANAMQDAGVQSTVFVSAEAVQYALKKGSNEKFAGSSAQEWISKLIQKGGKVMICEGFVKLGGIKKSDMVEGVGVSSPADLAGALYAPNTQAMTF
ncbi:MAG: DsrE family protein [Sulfurimonadaceae bacterium]|jgi:predicted peroxiredoxin